MRVTACRRWVVLFVAVAAHMGSSAAQDAERYRLPPQEIVDILDHPPTPFVRLSPDHAWVLLLHRSSMPSIEEVSSPMLALAGYRIDPSTNGPARRGGAIRSLTVQSALPPSEESVDRPHRTPIQLPSGAGVVDADWSPDGHWVSAAVDVGDGIELWIADPSTGEARKLLGPRLNAVLGGPCTWSPDSASLLCRLIPDRRGKAPEAPRVPQGPSIFQTSKGKAQVRTYQDLLKDQHDEDLYAYYFTSQLAWVPVDGASIRPIGGKGIYATPDISPDGRYLLVEKTVEPFSRLVTHFSFPKEVEVWDTNGRRVQHLTSRPLALQVPIGGVAAGPRSHRWKSSAPATVAWTEALDGGDPKTKADFRDRILMLDAPFSGEPRELTRTEFRAGGVYWGSDGMALVGESDRRKQWTRTWLIDENAQGDSRKSLLWERGRQDAYNDPGSPELIGPPGRRVLAQNGDWILLSGRGSSPEGDRPFLDRFNLRTHETERLFHCQDGVYEQVVEALDPAGARIVTRIETPTDPPNYLLRDLKGNTRRALTAFTDPAPQLRRIAKELITYQRRDGVDLSGTLYLPADYRSGQRLPVVMWAYPREYNDARSAGQVRGSPYRFTSFSGPTHLFFLLRGYAVLDGPAMPIIGEQGNDTFVEQLVMDAEAAVEKVVSLGVADPDRIGIGGHSYGAFMTANLLEHSDLFRAGVARSGAYNRTLTPFGFQNERRTYWEAPDVYNAMSPFMNATKLDEPILMIHGEADNNSGTFPIQSERLYHALNGLGGTARLVMLPHEAHGYSARESVLHVLAEMIDWFDKYVKNAPRRPTEDMSGDAPRGGRD